jgi:geranylgeranyl reductase
MSTVVRETFDNWLLEQAVEEGVEFQSDTRIDSMCLTDSKATVQIDSGKELTAKYLIDASGTNSKIAKQVGVDLQTVDLGLEIELAAAASNSTWSNRIHLDWGPIPGSYGWLFPKGATYTVGVIGPKQYGGRLRTYLGDFVRQLGVDQLKVVRKTSGHQTRCRTARSPLSVGRMLLVGDSAGLMEPWTREGISFAVRSGKIAGEVLILALTHQARDSAVSQLYNQRLEEAILPEMRAGFAALGSFERHPKIYHALLANTGIGWKYFTRITTGDTTLARAMRHATVRTAVSALNRF